MQNRECSVHREFTKSALQTLQATNSSNWSIFFLKTLQRAQIVVHSIMGVMFSLLTQLEGFQGTTATLRQLSEMLG